MGIFQFELDQKMGISKYGDLKIWGFQYMGISKYGDFLSPGFIENEVFFREMGYPTKKPPLCHGDLSRV